MTEPQTPSPAEREVHRFGQFELDVAARELRHRGAPLATQRRVFDLLLHLVRRRGQAVSRDELLRGVWHDVAVEDGSISRAIRLTRQILARDEATADALETIRGHGYRIRLPAQAAIAPGGVAAGPGRAPPDFFGREAELETLARCLERAPQTSPQLVLVSGEAGIGKTALVDRALAEWAAGGNVGRGVCLEAYGAGEPYLPLLQALGEIGEVEAFASGPDGSVSLRRLTDSLTSRLREGPVVLVIEDLHWSDASTLEALALLLVRVREPGLIVIGTRRSTDPGNAGRLDRLHEELSGTRRVREIALERLAASELRAWLARRVGGDVPESVVAQLDAASGGNPLFVRALLEDSDGRARGDTAPVEIDALTARLDTLPRALAALVARRVERLDPRDRRLLRCAAVAGTTPTVVRVAAASGLSEGVVEERLDALATRGGWFVPVALERWPDGSLDTRLEFSHGLHVDALYASIPLASRARMHAAIAARLAQAFCDDPGRVAVEITHHLEQSEQHGRALHYRVEAAQHAVRRNAGEEARFHARTGLSEVAAWGGADGERLECDLQLALALATGASDGHGHPQVTAAYERACDLALQMGDESRLLSAIWGLASGRLMRGEIDASAGAASALLARGEERGHRAQQLVAHDLLSEARFFGGRFGECAEHADRMLALYRPEQDRLLEQRVAQAFGVTSGSYGALSRWHLGQTTAALRASRSATAAADRLGHPFSRAVAHCFAAVLAQLLEDDAAVMAHAETLARVAEEADLPLWRGTARMLLGSTRPGDAGVEEMMAGLAELAGTGRLGGTYFLGVLAEKKDEAGDCEAARGLVEAALGMVDQIGERHDEANLHVRRARLAQDPQVALAACRRAAEIAEHQGSVAIGLRALTAEAELLLASGEDCTTATSRIRALSERIDPALDTPELRAARRVLQDLPRARVVSIDARRNA